MTRKQEILESVARAYQSVYHLLGRTENKDAIKKLNHIKEEFEYIEKHANNLPNADGILIKFTHSESETEWIEFFYNMDDFDKKFKDINDGCLKWEEIK